MKVYIVIGWYGLGDTDILSVHADESAAKIAAEQADDNEYDYTCVEIHTVE
mgnify:CR=1 FL=1